MNPHNNGKSRFNRQKQSTKSGIEDNTPEEEELKKYREIIERLEGEFKNKSGKSKMGSMYSSSMNTGGASKGNNKSSYMRRTTSRTKEVLNDRDFLINFMNNDSMPILPKNMHLLSDNDTNQSISDEEKFKNLADLMVDDRETVVESHFIKSVDDKMILKLYTALSRKSKDVFMDENHEEQSKNRILLHKLNNIKIPQHEIYDPSLDENNKNSENMDDSYESNKDNENLNDKKDEENNEEKKEEEKKTLEFNKNCKYNIKNKDNTIKIPTLQPYNPYLDKYHSRRFHKNRPKDLWHPEIDGDFLAYLNHNIVSIEDMYNKDKAKSINININLNNNNGREEEIKPIEAKEITYDNVPSNLNKSENNGHNTFDNNNNEEKDKSFDSQKKELSNIEEEENEIRAKNKFCEFKDRHPNLIEISLNVDPSKQKQNAFNNELKEIFYTRINEVGEYAEDIFPPKGVDLKASKIYRYALNNERNEEVSVDRMIILSTKKSTPQSSPKKIRTIEKSSTRKKKTMFINNKRKASDDNFIRKKKYNTINNLYKNINFSNLSKKKGKGNGENDNKTEISQNKKENIIQKKNDNTFSMIQKGSQNNDEENSIDKKSSSEDNFKKIFSSGSIKSDKEENDDNNNEKKNNDENNKENNNIENNNTFEKDLKNKNDESDDESEESEESEENDEKNKNNENDKNLEKINENDENKNNSSNNISNENLYPQQNIDNLLKLSFSANSGD